MNTEKQITDTLISTKNLPGAIMLSGEWGTGKTYWWNNTLLPALKKEKLTVIYLSLFGCGSVRQIKSDLITRLVLSNGPASKFDDKLKSFTKIAGNVGKEIASAMGDKAKEKFGINPVELFNKFVPDVDPLEFLPNGLVICFDDLERCPKDLLVDVLGLISFLIEERKAKVVVLANEKKLNENLNGIEYSEKVFWKTVGFASPLRDVFDVSVGLYVSTEAKKYVMDLKEAILKVFEKAEYSNIRTLNKILKWLSDLHDLKIKIDYPYAQYFTALLIHKAETGRLLKDSSIYSTGDGYRLSDTVTKAEMNKKELTLDPEEQESLAFYNRFSSGTNMLTSKSLHQLLYTNIIDEKYILNEIDPPNKQTKAYKVHDQLYSQRWFFDSLKTVKKLRSDALEILKKEKSMSGRYAMSIFSGIVKIDKVIGQSSEDAEVALNNFIDKANYKDEILSEVMHDMRSEEEKKILTPFYVKFKAHQQTKFRESLKAVMLKDVRQGNHVDLHSDKVRFSEALQDLAIDDDLNKAVEKTFFTKSEIHYDFYLYLHDRVRDEAIRKKILARLQDFKNNTNMDAIAAHRFDALLKKYGAQTKKA